jgi:serine/threonine-protein kinase
LNHPNIGAIYGLEDRAIVLELVEGSNLRGPLPLETALNYARQIAAGLEAAHEKGIVHRDLKPANIRVTPDGQIKLLDFGLAKAATEKSDPPNYASPALGSSMSPTISMDLKQAGAHLGTPAYMSPEQAQGKPVDKRADIWSFGMVLYELLTGRHPFAVREAGVDILTAVITREPDFTSVPPDPRVVRLLRRCLQKDPMLRLRDIWEARILLDEPKPAAGEGAPRRSQLTWAACAVALASLGAAGVAWVRPAETGSGYGAMRSGSTAARRYLAA